MFTVSGVAVTAQQVIIVVFGSAAAAALFVFFRVTRLGVAMRAVVDDPSQLSMAGSRPARVRRAAWMIGTTFTAASGVLFAEVQRQVQVDVLTLLIVQAFGAAALARFSNLPMAFVGGIAVGIVQKLVSKEAGSTTWLQGLDLNVPFLVLLAVLVFARRGSLKEIGRPVKSRAIKGSRFTGRQQTAGYGVGVAAIALLPTVVGTRLPLWNTAMALVCLFLSLSLLVRLSGQISLCQFGFAAIGAASFGRMLHHNLPWGVALAAAALITAAVGALIAIPAIRLSGLYLGLATLGFGIMLDQFFYTKSFMFGLSQQLSTPRPSGFTSDKQYFYVLLAFAVAGSLLVLLVERSRLGRLLRAVADAPVALSTLGADLRITLVIIFSMSAALAGISGALFAGLFGRVGGFSFPAIQSLLVLAVLFVAGSRLIIPAFIAPVLLFVVPGYIDNNDVFLGMQVGFGVIAFAVAALSSTDLNARFAAITDRDRLVGPADRSVNLPAGGRTPTRELELAAASH
jgi:ABC-type branched-subunit amino acid transport system permease subunit